jgi:hypothetical protein
MSTFVTSFSMTAEVPLALELGAGAVGLGLLAAGWGLGMIAGSYYGGRALHVDNEATGVLVGRLLMAAGIGLTALAPTLGPAVAAYVLGGLGGGFMGVASQSLIMRSVPDHLRARTQGAIEGGRNLAFGLGVIGAGTAVSVAGARPVYALVGVVMALGSTPVAMLVRRSRVVEELRAAGVAPIAAARAGAGVLGAGVGEVDAERRGDRIGGGDHLEDAHVGPDGRQDAGDLVDRRAGVQRRRDVEQVRGLVAADADQRREVHERERLRVEVGHVDRLGDADCDHVRDRGIVVV